MHRIAAFFLITACSASAQWTMQESHTTADLRGIANVGRGIAWASGTHGTVLRTVDDGKTWQACAVPPDAEKLDFRGVQAFDAKTAIVMSSGPGDASRLYKTVDGCATWTLVFTNPDKDGFWDAIVSDEVPVKNGQGQPIPGGFWLLGDPVAGHFPLRAIVPEYPNPDNFDEFVKADRGEAAFAASNSSLLAVGNLFWIATGGLSGARVIRKRTHNITDTSGWVTYPSSEVSVGSHTESSGIFSLAGRDSHGVSFRNLVAVGGDYKKPDGAQATAAYSTNDGARWKASQSMPHGYRSSVGYDDNTKAWITVGPNGTDISVDDGRNWKPLHPDPSFHEAADADKNWNALSLPFVVGPKGRIAILRDSAIEKTKQ